MSGLEPDLGLEAGSESGLESGSSGASPEGARGATLGLARGLSLIAALLSVTVWGWLGWSSLTGAPLETVPPVLIGCLLFPGLAIAGARSTWVDAPLVTGITGLIGLVPVGLYFLVAPGWLKLIGVPPLLLLAAAGLMLWGERGVEG
jgi:hypothetical protein